MKKLSAELPVTVLKRSQYTRPALLRAADLVLHRYKPVIVELGTGSGASMRSLMDYTGWSAGTAFAFTFDSFEGLPEDWREGYPRGTFTQNGRVPDVAGATVYRGYFDETLPKFCNDFLDRGYGPIDLLHVDCDLYSSTATALSILAKHITAETVIVFDELVNYPGWEEHEFKALTEFLAARGLEVSHGTMTDGEEQVILQLCKDRFRR